MDIHVYSRLVMRMTNSRSLKLLEQ